MNSLCRFYLLAAACCLLACAPRGEQAGSAVAGKEDQSFPMIEIPGMITDQSARVDYMTEHFWDRFNALSGGADSATIKGIPVKTVTESFTLWASVAKVASAGHLEKGIAAIPADLISIADEILYNPNSPTRSEEVYLAFLQNKLQGRLPDEAMRPEYERRIGLCKLNRPGEPASDFKFITREGRLMNLYSVKAPVLLLIFSNPGCPLCARYQELIQNNPALAEMQDKGSFQVLNIYPDEDVAAWEEYVRTYPKQWLCGRDPYNQLFNNKLYSLRAIPSLYLLDTDKKVILKDASYEEVEQKLYDILF